MDAQVEKIRKAVAAMTRRGRGHAFSAAFRKLVGEYGVGARAEGLSYGQIAERLGMASESVRRCTQQAVRAAAVPVVAVRVEQPSEATVQCGHWERSWLTVVSPRGYRLEGLDEQQALRVLEALS